MRTRTFLLAALIAALVPATARAQRTDADLFTLTTQALLRCPQYTIFDDVTLDVRDGVVRAMGQVTSGSKRDDIAAHLAKVPGVRVVTTDIDVLPPSDADASLRMRVAQAIYGNAAFWRYASLSQPPIHIVVSHGQVRLTGTVASEMERALAQSLSQVTGAIAVRNDLRLK